MSLALLATSYTGSVEPLIKYHPDEKETLYWDRFFFFFWNLSLHVCISISVNSLSRDHLSSETTYARIFGWSLKEGFGCRPVSVVAVTPTMCASSPVSPVGELPAWLACAALLSMMLQGIKRFHKSSTRGIFQRSTNGQKSLLSSLSPSARIACWLEQNVVSSNLWQERRENSFLQSQLCVLTLIWCPFQPLCYRSCM